MEILNNVKLTFAENARDNVGIIFNDGKLKITVPKMFRVDSDNYTLRKDLLLFLGSISIAKKINYNGTPNSKEKDVNWPIESFVWIIKDYLENGYYYKRETTYSNDRNGKIFWKRTLKNRPIISDDNIIYDKLVVSKRVPLDDLITNIYKICLKESLDKIGWLLNCKLKVKEIPIVSKIEMIYTVKIELSSTYDDIKRLRFQHMISILECIDDKSINDRNFQYQINNYYYVYEQMIDRIFGGISGKEKKRYNPSGYWILLGEEPKTASDLRPDTICMVEDETFIIDAKMYQYGCTHNIDDLPNTQSLQKQITYGEYIYNNIDKNGKVRNAFILPYNKELEVFKNDKNFLRYDDSNLIYIGEGNVDWTDRSSKKEFERIFTFLIDFNYLLNNYSHKVSVLNNLVNQIHLMLSEK